MAVAGLDEVLAEFSQEASQSGSAMERSVAFCTQSCTAEAGVARIFQPANFLAGGAVI